MVPSLSLAQVGLYSLVVRAPVVTRPDWEDLGQTDEREHDPEVPETSVPGR
jgi:hypothetical protein